MSLPLLNAAKKWAKKVNLPPEPRFVLFALADITNKKDGNKCWPDYDYIRDYTGFSRSAISKYLKILVASGAITVDKKNNGGKYANNTYFIILQGDTVVNPSSKRLLSTSSRRLLDTKYEPATRHLVASVNSTATTVSSNPEPASASPPLEQNPQTEPKSLPTFRPPAPSANEEDIQTIEEYKAGQEAWDNFGHDINDLFGIYPCDDEVQAVSSIIGEDYDLWSWVKKLAVSPRWKKIIKAPENLVFRMSPNPDTGSSAFMTACRKALQGSRRAASAFQNNPEKQSMKTAGFVVDDI